LYLAVSPLVIYLADTLSTLLVRTGRREPLFEAHRDHVYQRLLRGGWSHPQSACYVALMSALVTVLAAWAVDGPTLLALTVAVIVVLVYLTTPRWAGLPRRSASGAG
jgi:UDP-N-acetylmuramyl pentapeptide phosphotransferase/UDP-N-acetylglucosamine-1-phosphate transferase